MQVTVWLAFRGIDFSRMTQIVTEARRAHAVFDFASLNET